MIVAVFFFAACTKDTNQPDPVNLNSHELKVLKQGNTFGFSLFDKIGKEDPNSNLCISPYSVYTALAMAANGANGQTLNEMLGLLGFKESELADLNASVKDLNQVLIGKDPLTIFETANSVWYNTNGFEVYPDFVVNMQTWYSARVEGLDFSSAAALPTVNSWVKEKTHEKIDRIIDQINPQDVCFLINALYFNGKWTEKFDKKYSEPGNFQNISGEIVEVPVMFRRDTINIIDNEGLKAVELPYGDGSWSMYLFLPPQGENVDDWCTSQLSANWSKFMSEFKPAEGVRLYLPQFKIESSLELSKELKLLGIPTAFSGSADFSKLGPGSLNISQVLHKTYIDVNEDGTEAAAVTAVVIRMTSSPSGEFRFNRPFVFVIAEKSTGSIIFLGKVMKLK